VSSLVFISLESLTVRVGIHLVFPLYGCAGRVCLLASLPGGSLSAVWAVWLPLPAGLSALGRADSSRQFGCLGRDSAH
jgi:hypothetical protein